MPVRGFCTFQTGDRTSHLREGLYRDRKLACVEDGGFWMHVVSPRLPYIKFERMYLTLSHEHILLCRTASEPLYRSPVQYLDRRGTR